METERAAATMISAEELGWAAVSVFLTLLFSIATGFYRARMSRQKWVARILASVGCSVTASIGVRWYYQSNGEDLNANVLMLAALGVGLFFDNIWAARELIWDKWVGARLGLTKPEEPEAPDQEDDPTKSLNDAPPVKYSLDSKNKEKSP